MLGVKSLSITNCPQSSVSFCKKAIPKPDEIKEGPDAYELTYKADAGSGKKLGVGISSAILPGVGQAMNGQWGKGTAFLLSCVILEAVKIASSRKNYTAPLIASLGLIGLRILAAVDAVKSAKTEVKQVVPKNSGNINFEA